MSSSSVRRTAPGVLVEEGDGKTKWEGEGRVWKDAVEDDEGGGGEGEGRLMLLDAGVQAAMTERQRLEDSSLACLCQ